MKIVLSHYNIQKIPFRKFILSHQQWSPVKICTEFAVATHMHLAVVYSLYLEMFPSAEIQERLIEVKEFYKVEVV